MMLDLLMMMLMFVFCVVALVAMITISIGVALNWVTAFGQKFLIPIT